MCNKEVIINPDIPEIQHVGALSLDCADGRLKTSEQETFPDDKPGFHQVDLIELWKCEFIIPDCDFLHRNMQVSLLLSCFLLAASEPFLSSAHMIPDETLSTNRVTVSNALSQNLEVDSPAVVIVGTCDSALTNVCINLLMMQILQSSLSELPKSAKKSKKPKKQKKVGAEKMYYY